MRKAKTLRLYSLDAVTPSRARAAGRGRLADESDRELVLDWFRDFAETVGLPAHQREAIRDEAAAFLEAGTVYCLGGPWRLPRHGVPHTRGIGARADSCGVRTAGFSWARLRERVRVLRLPRAQG